MSQSNPKASIIIIGNEILSGRTLDTNTRDIALSLEEVGIILMESRTIPDEKEIIKRHVIELSNKYDYVFTTGGIGPTPDDVTAESIASAFSLRCIKNEQIYQILQQHYQHIGTNVNEPGEKMCYIPEGAKLLFNDASIVPGFVTYNVYSMAGIPRVMKSMLASTIPNLRHGKIIKSAVLNIEIVENKIANELFYLQREYPEVSIGSYPYIQNHKHCTSLVIRSSHYQKLNLAFQELQKFVNQMKR